jgi:multicomponent Na+:H+ antiporter subunit E
MVFDAVRTFSLALWAYAVWLLLTWTATAEQLVFGAVLAAGCGLAMAPLGTVVAPWTLLAPRRLIAIVRLGGYAAVQVLRANVALARRIWAPSRPLTSGMVIVRTQARTDGELAATGVITSLIVDNQLVDLDRSERVLQYHVVELPDGDARAAINGPIERRVAKVRKPR